LQLGMRRTGMGWPSGGNSGGGLTTAEVNALSDDALGYYSDLISDSGAWDSALASLAGEGGNDVLTTDTLAPRTTVGNELAARIKAAGGRLLVSQGDSALVVAMNNTFQFAVKSLGGGQFEIRESGYQTYLIYGGIALVAIVAIAVMSRR
jgi:hypothetical protein